MHSNKLTRRQASPRREMRSKSPKQVIVTIPPKSEDYPLLASQVTPRNLNYRNAFVCSSANGSPRSSQKKIIRHNSSKRRLKSPLFKSPVPRSPRSNRSKRKRVPETGNSPQLASFVTKVQSPVSKDAESRSEVLYKEHLFTTFQALKFARSLPPITPEQISQKRLELSRRPGYEDKKLAVFDLDETLVHCCDDVETSDPDFVVPITFPNGEVIEAGLNLRPFALECLQEANKLFEVAVFTASHQCYADVVLDYLDPKRKLIHHRLYRDNCIYNEGVYIKDLRVFGNRNVKDIVIVDNAAYSFAYQLDNGIPIISWHDDYNDRELFNLIDYLKLLAQAEDIREINRETFHMRTFYEDYMQEVFGSESSNMVRSKSPEIMNNLARKNHR